jgi:uncharacterized protein (DUF433 family)
LDHAVAVYLANTPLISKVDEVRQNVAAREPKMAREIAPRIVVDANVRFGKPVIRGTRVPVDMLIARLGTGMTFEEVAEEYQVTGEDILAALSYAAAVLSSEEVRETA